MASKITINDITYTFNNLKDENGSIVTETLDNWFKNDYSKWNKDDPKTHGVISGDLILEKVIKVGGFGINNLLKNVILPDCKELKVEAFYMPTSYSTVGGTTYYSDINYTIPKLEIIGKRALYGNPNLDNIDFSKVTRIYEDGLSYTNLKNLNLSNVEELGDSALAYNKKLISVKLSNKIKKIPYGCFQDDELLVMEELPETIEEIEGMAFSNCENLGLKKFPNNLKKVAMSCIAFAKIDIIVNFPESVEEITGSVVQYQGNPNFYINKLPNNLKRVSAGGFSFSGMGEKCTISVWDKKFITECYPYSLSNTHVSFSHLPYVTSYGRSCLSNCPKLTNLTLGSIGNPVTFIDTRAFEKSINIKQLKVYTIGGQALAGAPWGATNAAITYLPA